MRCHVVIPAAGVGKRFGGDRPKQYMDLLGHNVLWYSVWPFLQRDEVASVVVALATDDPWRSAQDWPEGLAVETVIGGSERADSVWNALLFLQPRVQSEDWVMVHDAARPCVLMQDIDRLMQYARDDSSGQGALLAVPVADTVKQAGADKLVCATVDRSELWRALTPQIFPWEALYQAMAHCRAHALPVTDESSAVEHGGGRPRLLPCTGLNPKITWLADIQLAEMLLSAGRS